MKSYTLEEWVRLRIPVWKESRVGASTMYLVSQGKTIIAELEDALEGRIVHDPPCDHGNATSAPISTCTMTKECEKARKDATSK